jgi:nucleoside-diphosphate kinase
LEQTLVFVKPDGVQRGLIGEVIARLERRGLKLVAAKFMNVSQELAEKHYAIHKGKPFYEGLIKYITSAPVMAMVWEGPRAIEVVLEVGRNLTHASDSVENGQKEIALWFKPEELVSWKRATDAWIYE